MITLRLAVEGMKHEIAMAVSKLLKEDQTRLDQIAAEAIRDCDIEGTLRKTVEAEVASQVRSYASAAIQSIVSWDDELFTIVRDGVRERLKRDFAK